VTTLARTQSNGTAAGTIMVKDIQSGRVANHAYLTNANGTAFFVAYHEDHSSELWKSDGTAAGTTMVKDIYPNMKSSFPGARERPGAMVNVNDTLFFTADDGIHGLELWKSNGTAAGTTLIKDILPGAGGSYLYNLVNVNGTRFFVANDEGLGRYNLWKSNGTTAGTIRVKKMRYSADNLMNVNETLFFTTHAFGTTEIWKSDGTETGTVLVKQIRPEASNSELTDIVNVNGTLFLTLRCHIGGTIWWTELWKSDSTEAGTMLVRSFSSYNPFPTYHNLTDVNGTLFFTVDTIRYGKELWKSDGTAEGTVLVKDIVPGTGGSFPSNLANMNGTLFFSADNGSAGYELWKSDGTVDGTVLVKDIYPGALGSDPSSLTNANGTLFFAGNDGTSGRELWKSDGSAAGTVRVKDIAPGNDTSSPSALTYVDDTLFFAASDGGSGYELWKSDGTATGTVRVQDIAPGTASSNPMSSNIGEEYTEVPTGPTVAGPFLFFPATDGVRGVELWAIPRINLGPLPYGNYLPFILR
jgi:ELWxxDGT repeat protein